MNIAPHIPPEHTFIANKCFLCGRANRSLFTIAEIHLHYISMNYLCTKEFFNSDYFPNVKEIRNHIWQISNGNKFLVEHAMRSVKYRPNLRGMREILQWFTIYRKVRELVT